MSKFNSETSFLYQLFKGNSNFIVLKPWKAFYLYVFQGFHCYFEIDCQNFLNSIYIYITPSNQHFKAFPMSKFNSETSFLYQLFKGNSNFTVWKPWKVIYLSVFYDFHCYLYLFTYMFIYAFIHLHINILKPSRCLNSIPRQVFFINFSRGI